MAGKLTVTEYRGEEEGGRKVKRLREEKKIEARFPPHLIEWSC
jgi:hypothetical protein